MRIDEAKTYLPLPELMAGLGYGDHAKPSARCPFHKSKSKNFSVTIRKGKWQWICYTGCGRGDEIDFVMQVFNLNKKEGARKFLELAGGNKVSQPHYKPKPIPPEPPKEKIDAFKILHCWKWKSSLRAIKLLATDLSVEYTSLLKLGCIWNGNEFAFPMFAAAGQTCGISMRNWHGEKWLVKGSEVGLFIPRAPVQKRVHIVEGASDLAALLDMGLYGIGRFNCNSLVETTVKTLHRLNAEEVVIIADSDWKEHRDPRHTFTTGIGSLDEQFGIGIYLDLERADWWNPELEGAVTLFKACHEFKCALYVPLRKDFRASVAAGLTKSTIEGIKTV